MYVCVCVYICIYIHIYIFFVHSIVDGHLGCFCVLAIVNNAVVNMRVKYLLKIMISFPLDIYPYIELLDHMVVLFLIVWRTSILFSIVAAPVYIPTNNVQIFSFLHIFTAICYLLYLIIVILTVCSDISLWFSFAFSDG